MIPREVMHLAAEASGPMADYNVIDAVIQSASYGGGQVQYQCLADGLTFTFSQPARSSDEIRAPGEKAKLCFSAADIRVLDRN